MNWLWHLFGRGFKGGPDFNLNRTHCYDLNGIELEITMPDSNIVMASSGQPHSFPFKTPGWFEENCSQLSNHFYVFITGGMWGYVGPYRKVLREPFGALKLKVWIKRVLPEHQLVVGELDALESAIRWDYEKYFEVDEPGNYGQGKNRKTRKEAEERFEQSHWQNDEGKRRKALYIQKYTRALPQQFEVREYGMQRWLYYSLESEPNYPSHHYCQPLDEQYYVDIVVGYVIDFSEHFLIWKSHAEAAEQRIIEMVRLNFPDRVNSEIGVKSLGS